MFQSTRPRGARRGMTEAFGFGDMFQSTRPHRARPLLPMAKSRSYGFNPRAPRGARRDNVMMTPVLVLFQSTRSARWGATALTFSTQSGCTSFNPRARRGRDDGVNKPHTINTIVNPFREPRQIGSGLATVISIRCSNYLKERVQINARTLWAFGDHSGSEQYLAECPYGSCSPPLI